MDYAIYFKLLKTTIRTYQPFAADLAQTDAVARARAEQEKIVRKVEANFQSIKGQRNGLLSAKELRPNRHGNGMSFADCTQFRARRHDMLGHG